MKLQLPVVPAFILTHLLTLLPNLTARAASQSAQIFSNQNDSQHENETETIHPLTLEYLGKVDEKEFFVEHSRLQTWTEAKYYCEAADLKLASIDTKAEADFLNQTLRQFPYFWYWTSLHESRRPSMMEWDGTNAAPDPSFLQDWSWQIPAYQYCTLFHLVNASNYRMLAYRCNYTDRLLCQKTLIK